MKRKRSNSVSDIKQTSFINRIKQTAMTILGYILPEQSPWVSFSDVSQEWGPGRMMSPWFDRWREPVLHSARSHSRGKINNLTY